MRIFLCWWGGGYTRSLGEHEIEWFTIDRGYEQSDINTMDGMEIGDTIVMSNGDHIVTRVE